MPKIEYTEKFLKFWQIYPEDLSHGKKGSKFQALKAFLKYTEDEQDRIIFDTEALLKFDRQDTKPDRWPHASTYLNQRYFEREVGSVAELKEKAKLSQCKHCENEVIGPRFDVCGRHLETQKERLNHKKNLKDLGILTQDLSLSELAILCREYLKQNGGFGKVLKGMISPEKR